VLVVITVFVEIKLTAISIHFFLLSCLFYWALLLLLKLRINILISFLKGKVFKWGLCLWSPNLYLQDPRVCLYLCPHIYAMNIATFASVPDWCFSDHHVCHCPQIYSYKFKHVCLCSHIYDYQITMRVFSQIYTYKITMCVSVFTFMLIRSPCMSLSPYLCL
jgi:hypothetical protein